jgi:hypothetical protein
MQDSDMRHGKFLCWMLGLFFFAGALEIVGAIVGFAV